MVKAVPAGATAIGIPARIVESQDTNQAVASLLTPLSRDANDPLAQGLHELIDHSAETDRRIEQILAELQRLGGEVERQRAAGRSELSQPNC